MKQGTVNVFHFYAGSSDVSKADVVSPKQKSALGIGGIYLKKNIRLRNFLYSRELITWHVDVLEKQKNIFQRPYRQGESETENILRVIFDKRLLFAGRNLSTLVTKDVNGQKTQREHV